MSNLEKLKFKLEQLNASIRSVSYNPEYTAIDLLRMVKQRAALEEEIEDEEYAESERGEPDMDGCEEYARRFAAA